MDTRWKKIWQDLALRKGRTLVTLLGLVIGLWGIGAVSVAYFVLSNDLAENFVRTNPPNLVFNVDNAGVMDLDPVAALAGVQGVENRPLIRARIETAPDTWLPMLLFVVDDFQDLRVAGFWPEADAFPPPEGSLVIERAGKLLIRFMGQGSPASNEHSANTGHADGNPGSQPVQRTAAAFSAGSLRVRLPGGIEAATEIAGTVFDPGQAPSTMERIIYGYVSRATADAWMPGGFEQRVLVRLEAGAQDPARQRAMAAQIGEVLAASGAQVSSLTIPPADEHPHQFQMNSILFLVGGVGVVALLLSMVLVVNLVNGLLTNQIRQIGSLKAIGATTTQVAMLYLAGVFLLGLAACAFALPLAERAGYGLSKVLAGMLNFEILTTQLPVAFYLALILAGALFPVLAAFLPVRRWSGVPVRDALDNYGAGNRAMSGSLLDRLPLPLPVSLRLGVRNALRNPKRFVLGLLTLTTGALVFMITMNVRSSLLYTADVEIATRLYDISVQFEEEVSWDQISWITGFPEVEGIELWQAARARVVDLDAGEANALPLIAVPADTRALLPNLVQGQWVSDSEPLGVVASHRFMALHPGLEPGDRMTLEVDGRRTAVTLRGVNRQFGGTVLYISATGFRALTGQPEGKGRVALVSLTEAAFAKRGEMVTRLEQHFDMLSEAGRSLKVSSIQTSKMASAIIRNHLDMIVWTLGVMAALMLTVSGLGMASGIGASVIERTRELGVLRAIGATPAAITRILSVEALFTAAVAWLIALAAAAPLSRNLAEYFGTAIVEYPFDYRTSMPGAWLSLAVIAALALLSTYGPTRMATRQEVGTAVSYE